MTDVAPADSILTDCVQAAARLLGDRLPATTDLVPGAVLVTADLAAHAMPPDGVAVTWPLEGGEAVLVVAIPADAAAMLCAGPPATTLPTALTDRLAPVLDALAPLFSGRVPALGPGTEVPPDAALADGPGDAVSVGLDDAGNQGATMGLRLVVTDALLAPTAGAAPAVEVGAAAVAPSPVAVPASGVGTGAPPQPAPVAATGPRGVPAAAPAVHGDAHPAQFASFDQLSSLPGGSHSMAMLGDVEMGVTAELGRTRLTVRDVLGLNPGSIIELDRAAGSPVDVVVNGTLIARGEVVVIDEEFGIRITEIVGMAAAPEPFPLQVAQ